MYEQDFWSRIGRSGLLYLAWPVLLAVVCTYYLTIAAALLWNGSNAVPIKNMNRT